MRSNRPKNRGVRLGATALHVLFFLREQNFAQIREIPLIN